MYLTEEKKQDIIDQVQGMLGDHKLLYLALYGSHLYSTNTATSDMDIRGVFLPNKDSLYLNQAPREFNYTTGNSTSKNTANDIDVKLFSVQKFIELVRKGDTNGLDLLFSLSNEDCVVYYDLVLENIMTGVENILDIRDANAYVGYAIGQARKYGIKGSKLGVLKQIKELLDSYVCFTDQSKLSDIVDDILKVCGHESYCFKKEQKGLEYLVVCGSMHQLNISLEEFYNRINNTYNEYGTRAEEASKNEGIDWKALSHAVRVLLQCIELYTTGQIVFPILCKDLVLRIKNGEIDYKVVETLICSLLEQVDRIKLECKYNYRYSPNFVLNELRSLYEGENYEEQENLRSQKMQTSLDKDRRSKWSFLSNLFSMWRGKGSIS